MKFYPSFKRPSGLEGYVPGQTSTDTVWLGKELEAQGCWAKIDWHEIYGRWSFLVRRESLDPVARKNGYCRCWSFDQSDMANMSELEEFLRDSGVSGQLLKEKLDHKVGWLERQRLALIAAGWKR